MLCYDLEPIVDDTIDESVQRLAQARCMLRDRIQHRLNIGRRTCNDAQNLTRRGLLLQRLLEFLEQPDILDCDHRLISESFDQSDLAVGELASFGAVTYRD